MAKIVSELPTALLFGMGTASLGFGGIAALAAGKTLLQIKHARHWPLIPATITALEISEHRARGGRSRLAYSARVTFGFVDNTGKTRHVRYETAQGSRRIFAAFEIGKPTALRVNPHDFTDFRLSLWPDTSERLFILAMLSMGGFGLGLLGMAISQSLT